MKKIMMITATVLLLAGCSSTSDTTPADPAPVTGHAKFEQDVLAMTSFANNDPATLDTVGDDVCQAFDAGSSEIEIATTLSQHSMSPKQASSVLVAAVYDLCPTYKDQLPK